MFNFLKKNKTQDKKTVEVKSPFVGRCFKIKEIPDEVFASNMMGEGIGFEPKEGVLYSPIDGEIVQVFPTKHAVILRSDEGLEILLHMGLETVNMKGEGFKTFASTEDKVKAGDKLVEFDLDLINQKANSILSVMVITNKDIIDSIDINYGEVDKESNAAIIHLK